MAQAYKIFISDDIAQEKMRERYGEKYKLKVAMSYQHKYKSCKIDVVFTKDKKAYWIFKYKGEYYMNIIEDIVYKDRFVVIDIYTTLIENAIDSYNHAVEKSKMERNND